MGRCWGSPWANEKFLALFVLGALLAGCGSRLPDDSPLDSASVATSKTALQAAPGFRSAPAAPSRGHRAGDVDTGGAAPEDGSPQGDRGLPQLANGTLWAGPNQMCVLASGSAKCFGSNLLGAPTGQYSYDRGIEASDMGSHLPAVDLGAGCGGARAVATGAYHACALLESGKVKCWGSNRSGELGLGDTTNRTAGAGSLGRRLPEVDLGRGQRARMIAAGLGFTCALLECGTVKCWGDNGYASLGAGDSENRGDGPGEMGDALPAVNLGSGRTAKLLAAGHAHACAILDDDSLKCWGLNNYGQLGQGDARSRGAAAADMGDALLPVDLGVGHHAKSLSLGAYQTCAILENDQLKCWGANLYGNLGLGDTRSRGDAPGQMGDNLPPVDLGQGRSVRSVAVGGGFACAVLDDHSLKCWGDNSNGALGLGDRAARGDAPGEMGDALPPVDLGARHTARRALATFLNACAELDDGKVKCWGSSVSGMLGIGPSNRIGAGPSEMGDHLRSFDLGYSAIQAFGAGFPYHYGCALTRNGAVKCWGANSYGQLGIDRSSNTGDEPGDMGRALASVSLGTGRSVLSIAPGQYHSCAVLDTGKVKCWGANLFGSLGQGDNLRRDGRPSYMGDHLPNVDLGSGQTARVVSVGSDHSCAILDGGGVKCWGDNSKGELGLGDTNDRGDAPDEMADALPTVDLGTGRTAKALSLGHRHTCALLDNDTIKCWGWNLYGQLGIAIGPDRGGNPGEMGDALPSVQLGDLKPVAVYAGYANTCATFHDGSLKCWGLNQHGELGQEDTIWRGGDASRMGNALRSIKLGAGRTAQKVGVGVERICALLDDQTVKCWGYGAYGALGQGSLADRGGNPGDMGDSLTPVNFGPDQRVHDLAVSWYDSCVQLATGMKCWGWNQLGQLGLGDTQDRGGKPNQMGAQLRYVDLQR